MRCDESSLSWSMKPPVKSSENYFEQGSLFSRVFRAHCLRSQTNLISSRFVLNWKHFLQKGICRLFEGSWEWKINEFLTGNNSIRKRLQIRVLQYSIRIYSCIGGDEGKLCVAPIMFRVVDIHIKSEDQVACWRRLHSRRTQFCIHICTSRVWRQFKRASRLVRNSSLSKVDRFTQSIFMNGLIIVTFQI